MTRRVLIIEADPATRAMMERALSIAGYSVASTETIESARSKILGRSDEVAVIDLRASQGDGVTAIRLLRDELPDLPIVVTGTLLTPRVLQTLIRIGIDDVLPKPFSPSELSMAVERTLRRSTARATGSLSYAAAIAATLHALGDGNLGDAKRAIARAHAEAPDDAEAMALTALIFELSGDDDAAARAYGAALALDAGDADAALAPSPREGLARLALYDGARVVDVGALRDEGNAIEHGVGGGRSLFVVDDMSDARPPESGEVVALFVGLSIPATGAVGVSAGSDAAHACHARRHAKGGAFLIDLGSPTEAERARLSRALPGRSMRAGGDAATTSDAPVAKHDSVESV